MPKAMILSLGGSPAALLYSLNKNKPAYIIFFVSRASKNQIAEIANNLSFHPQRIEYIETVSAEKLSICYETIRSRLSRIMADWHLKPKELLVDYTGATKSMSVALVLATIEMGCRYSYIGGVERKNGLGVVIDGKEKMYFLDNPWEKFSIAEEKRINTLLEKGLYEAATEGLKSLIKKAGHDKKIYYQLWLDIVSAYQEWDKFEYKQAFHDMNKSLRRLELLKEHKRLSKHIRKNCNYLRMIVEGKNDEFLVYDLIANAKRRAEIEARYDDAVSRIYRAIEKIAQIRLKSLGINPSNVKLDLLPPNLREEFKAKYMDEDGRIKLPLYADYRLLYELKDDIGKRFFENEKEIKSILDRRNSSKLAHGDNPIDKDGYEKLLDVFLKFSGIDSKCIPEFPVLNL
jgi:CRISPR-associated protein (TIGR02710 family)